MLVQLYYIRTYTKKYTKIRPSLFPLFVGFRFCSLRLEFSPPLPTADTYVRRTYIRTYVRTASWAFVHVSQCVKWSPSSFLPCFLPGLLPFSPSLFLPPPIPSFYALFIMRCCCCCFVWSTFNALWHRRTCRSPRRWAKASNPPPTGKRLLRCLSAHASRRCRQRERYAWYYKYQVRT